jgi:hypothetical protein
MAFRYYYIDDDPKPTITETAKGLSIYPQRLLVVASQHEKWDDQIKFIIESQNSLDGLLLDWNLRNENEKGEKVNYNVEALAQQIRSLAVNHEALKKDFPIILCSANFRFKEVFTKETSAHDLFDFVYEKDDFDSRQKEIISELEAIASAYTKIRENKSIKNILDIDEQEVDYRIVDFLLNHSKSPIHEIARFIFRNIIEPPGPLVSEHLLAARLGVDIIGNSNLTDWNKLKVVLTPTSYTGVFSNGWNRWWMHRVENFWHTTFENSIGNISGPERVKMINSKFELNLKPSELQEKASSNFFWVVSKSSLVPLAIEDAILADSNYNKAPWIEDEYYSINEALEGSALKIHPLEKERINKLKQLHTKKRVYERK